MATFSDRPWSGISASDYASTADYCDACLIDENPAGSEKIQANCKLPVKEPGGAYNRGAIRAALAVLAGARGGVQASAESKASARRTLLRLAREAKIEVAE